MFIYNYNFILIEIALAIKVIEQLSSRSRRYSGRSTHSTEGKSQSKPFTKLTRSKTWPKQRCHGQGMEEDEEFGIRGKKLRPHSAEMCSHCSSSDTGSIYASLKRCGHVQNPNKVHKSMLCNF